MCPGLVSRKAGTVTLHLSIATGHRVWKTHPDGGFAGLGIVPWRMTRSRVASIVGSGMGTADKSAFVYGCFGSSYSVIRSEISMILPRYMTAILSEMWRTTARSCAIRR